MERLCYATEFDIEGWKKILPLTDMIEEYIQLPLEKMKLKMHALYAVTKPVDRKLNTDDFIGKTIRNSKIYEHFRPESKDESTMNENHSMNDKLVIYVSQTIPINENYCRMIMKPGQHCVVAIGIELINDVEYLVLENTGDNKEFDSIPVDFPFFEEVTQDIETNRRENYSDPDRQNRKLNNHGYKLAQKKWKNLKRKDWNSMVQKEADRIEKNLKKEEEPEYQMFFVKGTAPMYKLEFVRL